MNDARCLDQCIPAGYQMAVLIALIADAISSGGTIGGGGGGGGTVGGEIRAGNYGGTIPNWTPASGVGIGFDTSDGTQYNYYSGAWH